MDFFFAQNSEPLKRALKLNGQSMVIEIERINLEDISKSVKEHTIVPANSPVTFNAQVKSASLKNATALLEPIPHIKTNVGLILSGCLVNP